MQRFSPQRFISAAKSENVHGESERHKDRQRADSCRAEAHAKQLHLSQPLHAIITRVHQSGIQIRIREFSEREWKVANEATKPHPNPSSLANARRRSRCAELGDGSACSSGKCMHTKRTTAINKRPPDALGSRPFSNCRSRVHRPQRNHIGYSSYTRETARVGG